MSDGLDKKIFFTLFAAIFATTLGVGLVIPILPVYAAQSGAGGFAVGMIFGAFSLSRSFFVPIFGKLSDSLGRKLFLSIGLFAYCLVSVAFVFSVSVYWLIIVRFFQGITSAMVLPVAFAYVGEIGPPNREGEVMGLFQISMQGGLSFGPFFGGVIKDAFGVNATFLSMAVICFVAFLLCAFLLPSKEEKRRTRPAGMSYMKLIKDRTVGALFVHRICLAVGVGVIWAFFPLLADEEFHLSSTSIGLVLMANVALSALCLYPMGLIADRFDKRIPAAVGGVAGALALGLLIHTSSLSEVLTIGIAHGLALGIIAPSMMAVAVIAGRDAEAMGTVMGVISMAHSLGMLVGPTLGGLIMDAFSFAGVFLFACVVLLAGTIYLLCRLPASVTVPVSKRRTIIAPVSPHHD